MNKKVVILGIDPGTIVTGFGIIRQTDRDWEPLDFGCIRPPRTFKINDRYLAIFEGIYRLIDEYKPQAVSVETQFVNRNIQSALKLGISRGAALIAAAKHGVEIYEYSPTKAKMAVVGNGAASKFQVQRMVQLQLKLSQLPEPEDAADALALALCHAHTIRAKSYV